jgi:hypothetical protein
MCSTVQEAKHRMRGRSHQAVRAEHRRPFRLVVPLCGQCEALDPLAVARAAALARQLGLDGK